MPRIAKLIPRRQRSWLEIVADDGESLRLPAERAPAGLAAGEHISDERWAELRAASAYFVLYDRALRILSHREHFISELRRKLSEGGASARHVEQALAECKRLGYLDDERAVETMTQRLLARGGIGRLRLREELLAHGCPPLLAASAVARHAAEIDEPAEIAALLAARRRQFASRLAAFRRKLEAQATSPAAPNSTAPSLAAKSAAAKSPAALAAQLRFKLGAAVLAYLAGRGFTGDEARSAARKLVGELLEDET